MQTISVFEQEILNRKKKDSKLSNSEIAKQLGLSEKYVKYVIEKHKEEKK